MCACFFCGGGDWLCWSAGHVWTPGGCGRSAADSTEGPAAPHQSEGHTNPLLRLKQSPGQMRSRANTGTQLRTHTQTRVSTWRRGRGRRADIGPGVTNGIAVCLPALQIYDLVTKWHSVVFHLLPDPGLCEEYFSGSWLFLPGVAPRSPLCQIAPQYFYEPF